jgi:mono/diheme cytochrome c family protein
MDPAPTLAGSGSYLLAWDPVTNREAWKQPLGGSRAGAMTTAGNLVFQGSVATPPPAPAVPPGFSAYRADTGERVWTTDTQAVIVGGAATYEVGGEQYVAVVAAGQQRGFGGGYWAPNYARLLVYKLGGNAVLPEAAVYTPPPLNPPPEFGDDALLAQGQAQYTAHCASCHGTGNEARVSSVFPDLRYAGALWSADAFKAIVIDGALQANGMVSFRKVLSPQDADAIRAHVVRLANQAKNAPPPPGFGGGGAPSAGPPAGAPPSSAPGASAPPPELHK